MVFQEAHRHQVEAVVPLALLDAHPAAELALGASMLRRLQARWALTAALLLMAALGVAFAQDFVHSDDGCQVEVHCLACQRTLLSVGVASLTQPWHSPIDLVGYVPPVDLLPGAEVDAPASASRAPPRTS